MKKLLAYTTAVVLLAGSLVGCGNSDTEESKTATETSIETEETVEITRANSKDGWGSTISKMGTDTGNFTKLQCGMSAADAADLGYGSKEHAQNFTENKEA